MVTQYCFYALEIKLKVTRVKFNGFFILKQIEKPWRLKKKGITFNYISCFSLHFFRALAASCVLNNRIEHSQSFSIC